MGKVRPKVDSRYSKKATCRCSPWIDKEKALAEFVKWVRELYEKAEAMVDQGKVDGVVN
jgi:hypothetical protein